MIWLRFVEDRQSMISSMWARMQNSNSSFCRANQWTGTETLLGFKRRSAHGIISGGLEQKSPMEKEPGFNKKMHLMEYALHADYALVKAWKGDRLGNLVFRKTTRNFSTSMAKAGNITIAEVEELVEPGVLDPDHVHVAGIYVHRIFQGGPYEKRIERKTVRIASNK